MDHNIPTSATDTVDRQRDATAHTPEDAASVIHQGAKRLPVTPSVSDFVDSASQQSTRRLATSGTTKRAR